MPAALDWDLWLGPAAPRPYNADDSGWRAFIDFSTGGSLGDWLVHCLGPAHLALRLDHAAPISVECVNVVEKNEFRWPLSDEVIFEFPARGNMPPVTIHAYQNMRGDFKNPPGMAEGERLLPPMSNLDTEKNRPFLQGGDGMMLVGDQLDAQGKRAPTPAARGRRSGRPAVRAGPGAPGGMPGAAGGQRRRGCRCSGWNAGRCGRPGRARGRPRAGAVRATERCSSAPRATWPPCNRGEGVWLLPASRWADYRLPPQMLQRGINHQQDWIRACKGGAPGVSEFAVACKYIEWLVLGAVALRVPGKLLWDAKNMRFTNNEEANKYLKPALRKGWELKL